MWSSPTGTFTYSVLVKVTLLGTVDGEPWAVWVRDGPNTGGVGGGDGTANMRIRYVGSPHGGGQGGGDLIPAASLAMLGPTPPGVASIRTSVTRCRTGGWSGTICPPTPPRSRVARVAIHI